MHKSIWQVNQFLNLFFMNAITRKHHSSSTNPNTWTHAISTSFINFKSLCLRMRKELILVQSLMTRFTRDFFPHDLFIVYSHSHFEIGALQIQSIAIEENFHQDPILSHFVRPTINSLDNYQMLVDNIFNIIKVINPKIKVDHT